MSPTSLTTAQGAAQKFEKRPNLSFGVGVAIVLILLAVLSVVTGVASIVDPVAFLAP